MKYLTFWMAGFALLSPGNAQVGETCSNPISIAGLGSFAFDTSLSTNSGFGVGFPCASFPIAMGQDQFFVWSAPFAGSFTVGIEDTNYAYRFGVYAGPDCNAVCIGSNTTSPFYSFVELVDVQPGDNFLIQLGGDPLATGTGSMVIAEHACNAILADALEPNDTCPEAVALGVGQYPGLTVRGNNPDYYTFAVPAGDWLVVEDLHAQPYPLEFTLWAPNTCGGSILRYGNGGLAWFNGTGSNQSYTLRISVYDVCREYDLSVVIEPHPCNGGLDDPFEDNDSCTTPAPIAPGWYPGLFTDIGDRDFYSICLPPGESLAVLVEHNRFLADLDLVLWREGSVQCTTSDIYQGLDVDTYFWEVSEVHWINTDPVAVNVWIEVWSDQTYFPGCNLYDLTVLTSGECGMPDRTMRFCDPADVNSTGASTELDAYPDAGAGSGVWLWGLGGPIGQFTFLLVGSHTSTPGLAISQGHLCLGIGPGQVIGRYNESGTNRNSVGYFDSWYTFRNPSGTGIYDYGFRVPQELPLLGNPLIGSGQTWHFQLWHRENGGASNFSNGVSVTF